ncbi:MAG: hypothetical protein Q7U16_13550 [Agitococcus sp.]|nr:hypothetical protein [Agitococcus sp.]
MSKITSNTFASSISMLVFFAILLSVVGYWAKVLFQEAGISVAPIELWTYVAVPIVALAIRLLVIARKKNAQNPKV